MSDAIGPLALLPRDGTSGPFSGGPELSPETQKLIDDEMRHIVSDAHQQHNSNVGLRLRSVIERAATASASAGAAAACATPAAA